MINKLDLQCDDRVVMYNSSGLDGKTGSVVGVSIRNVIDFYIILLDEPVEYEGFLHKAVSIPETCLKRI